MNYIKMFERFSKDKEERLNFLLDKISKQGIKSLSKGEKQELDNIDNPTYDKIKFINEYVRKNDNVVTLYELQIESPILKKEDGIISRIEVLFEDSCLVVDYDGEYPVGEYEEEYINIEESILDEIISEIQNFTS